MKNIVMASNPYRDKNFETARKAQKILRSVGIHAKLCLAFEAEKNFDCPAGLQLASLPEELPGAELLLCFGGDGTILHAAKAAAEAGIPVLGVNIGTMGFMAELESNEMHLLRKLRDDRYTTEARMMLQVEVIRGGEVVWQELALNDAVIAKGAVARIIQLTVVCDGVDVMQVIGDGLILGTPTGSTAYSMSAGGPIVEPTAHNILITPICAHDMMTRPFVTSSKRTISARIGKVGRRNAYLSIDGGKAFKLSTGDTIQVTRAARDAQLVKLKEQSFFEVVNQKFGTDKRRFL